MFAMIKHMDDPDFDRLVGYINQQLSSGVSQQKIRSVLEENNVSADLIDQAMNVVFKAETPTADNQLPPILAKEVQLPAFLTNLTLFRYRLDQRGFILGHVYILLIAIVFSGAAFGLWLSTRHIEDIARLSQIGYTFIAIALPCIGFIMTLSYSMVIRRGHDLAEKDAQSRVSMVGVYSFVLLFADSDKAENKYGAPVHSLNPFVILGLKKPSTNKTIPQ